MARRIKVSAAKRGNRQDATGAAHAVGRTRSVDLAATEKLLEAELLQVDGLWDWIPAR